MKMLIVEDTTEKMDSIVASISSEYYDMEIDKCDNIYEAKDRLCSTYYNILILDLNLPLDKNGDLFNDSGFDLYREIQKVDAYKKPEMIVMLTSYCELIEKYKSDIDNRIFTIIHYSEVDSEWRTSLIENIRYYKKSKEDYLKLFREKYEYDIAIITAVEIENNVVVKKLIGKESFKLDYDDTIYTRGTLLVAGHAIKVVTATQHQMGMTAASTLSMKLITNFRPKVIAMVGIAAGKKGEGKLGDIIAPFESWDYGSGKVKKVKDTTPVFLPDPRYLSLSVEFKEILQQDYKDILESIRKEWNFEKIQEDKIDSIVKHELNLIRGPMACGSIVVQNEELIEKYIEPHNRKIVGLDMESYGVFYAAYNCFAPKPKVIVLKSICDYADGDKADDYQEYASYTSASFFVKLLENGKLDIKP